ncbi:MAG: DUF2231 domain-containing protein [Chloroflexi bacterium]|nr:DUF2231 domain-containing protein [Chloroflexota bacterium]
MRQEIPSKAAIMGHPIHPMLVPFPIAALVGVLATDLAYTATNDLFWPVASRWLLIVGLITGVLAGVVGAIDYLGIPAVRRKPPATVHAVGNIIALLLSVLNLGARLQSPTVTMIGLSVIVTLVLVGTGWLGGELSYRHLVGVNSRRGDH